MKKLRMALMWLCLCAVAQGGQLHTNFLTPVCIGPLDDYQYIICNDIIFEIEGQTFVIPEGFKTDLASIPRMAWPYLSPAHSSLIRASIVHDWLYRMTCDFNRHETDLIFYHMLRNDGVSYVNAILFYYTVRLFGWDSYNEDYCDDVN